MEAPGEAYPRIELARAVKEYKLFLDEGYPRSLALDAVSTKNGLRSYERQLLYRTIHPTIHDRIVIEKTVTVPKKMECLIIDYYNVMTVVAEALQGHLVYRGSDGFTRDLAKAFGRSRKDLKIQEKAVHAMSGLIKEIDVRETIVIADKQVSHSGESMKIIREKIPDVKTILSPHADIEMLEYSSTRCPAATGDTLVLQKEEKVLDISYMILEYLGLANRVVEVWRLPIHYDIE